AEEAIVLHHCNADTRNRYWGDYLNFQCCIWRAAAASALRESRPNRRTERGQRAGRENAIRGPEFRGYPHTESLPAWTGRIPRHDCLHWGRIAADSHDGCCRVHGFFFDYESW